MLNKIADIKAAVNHYQSGGKQHTFYKPVGSLMLNPDTNQQFLLLDKSFNLMAVIGASDPEKGSVFLPLDFVDDKPPKQQNKPLSQKAKQSNDKTKKTRPTKAQIQAALSILDVDARAKQNKGKDGKHIDLPFDDKIGF